MNGVGVGQKHLVHTYHQETLEHIFEGKVHMQDIYLEPGQADYRTSDSACILESSKWKHLTF